MSKKQNFDLLPASINFTDNRAEAIFIFGGLVDLVKIWPNTGQVPGLPTNPRYILEKGLNDLNNSISDDPEYLIAHPLVLFPYADAFVCIEGNMRREACVANGLKKVPALVLNPNTPVEKLKAYMIKGNVGYGKWDYDVLAAEFELSALEYIGLEIPDVRTEPDDLDDTSNDKHTDPEAKLTLHFAGNLDKFEIIRAQIQDLIRDYPGISLK